MMFGLEGNGFLISITITLLLAGMITFYFRQQIGKVENKLTSMFQLIQSITSELNKINDLLVKENNLQQDPVPVQSVTENKNDYHQTTSFEGETTPQTEILENETSVEEVQIPMNVDSPRIEIHAVRLNPVEMMVGGMTNKEDDIKIVDLSTNDDDETESELESDSDEDENVELEVIKEPTNDEGKIEIKVEKKGSVNEDGQPEHTEKSKTLTIFDYSKMNVAGLREILLEKGLVTDARKLRKKEMLELLG